jgi:hypothetical protein
LVNPYSDIQEEGHFLREFEDDVQEEELIWHRDKHTRDVMVLEGSGWKLQLDNMLPVELKREKIYTIPMMEYHRLIKGTGKLVVKIWEKIND